MNNCLLKLLDLKKINQKLKSYKYDIEFQILSCDVVCAVLKKMKKDLYVNIEYINGEINIYLNSDDFNLNEIERMLIDFFINELSNEVNSEILIFYFKNDILKIYKEHQILIEDFINNPEKQIKLIFPELSRYTVNSCKSLHRSKKRYVLEVSDYSGNNYFLKISLKKEISKIKYEGFIECYQGLYNNLNCPKLIKTGIYFNKIIQGLSISYYLFELIPKSNEPLNNYNVNLLITEIMKLHELKCFKEKNKSILHKSNISKDIYLYPLVLGSLKYLKKNIDKYFKVGLCHWDLRPENIVKSKNKIYIVDFDNMRYDYNCFDIIKFSNHLIYRGRTDLAKKILHNYLKRFNLRNNNKFCFHASNLLHFNRPKGNNYKRKLNLIYDFYNKLFKL